MSATVRRTSDDRGKLHLTFLAQLPEPERVRAIPVRAYLPDELRVHGREVYLYCPNGYGRSKLSNAFFEARLGVLATTRNWNTVSKLLAIASSL